MNRIAKAINRTMSLIIAFMCIFVVLFMFVGCDYSEYKKTNIYAVFEDNLGNKYKVKGGERLKEEYDWRCYESSVKLDLNPDADYTFTGGLYYTNGGKEVVANDAIIDVFDLILANESDYNNIRYGYYGKQDISCIDTGESITLSCSEAGTYYLLLFTTYTFDNHTTADYYFLKVIIG
ncbi:MAG: hypothetical protein K2M47_07045 [Clostridiales bacterium]|nr:hypothetical protein [Clostridiales bacterium]